MRYYVYVVGRQRVKYTYICIYRSEKCYKIIEGALPALCLVLVWIREIPYAMLCVNEHAAAQ